MKKKMWLKLILIEPQDAMEDRPTSDVTCLRKFSSSLMPKALIASAQTQTNIKTPRFQLDYKARTGQKRKGKTKLYEIFIYAFFCNVGGLSRLIPRATQFYLFTVFSG